jgi:hypothetical protein
VSNSRGRTPVVPAFIYYASTMRHVVVSEAQQPLRIAQRLPE